jgi:putative transposase
MDWARVLAYVTGTVDQELLARNEYLAAENRILKAQLKGRLQLSDDERRIAAIGHRLGRKTLAEVATVARPAIRTVHLTQAPKLASPAARH